MDAEGASTARVLPSRLVLLGHPVAHSLSPRFHNAALREAGIPIVYEAVDTPPEALSETLEALRREGAAGNVTIPHKEAVRVACAEVTALAERAGAVNTFWTEHGVLHGDNTDIAGFEASATELLDGATAERRVAVLGAGGATRAVLTAVERWTAATVVLYGRTRERAETLAASFPVVRSLAASAESAVSGADLIVNASPIGLHDDTLPVGLDALSSHAAVLDLVYRPGETQWVRLARARGHRAADGKTMLLEQGARSFERWFGFSPDRDVMRAALD
jgi:shikimate dehydrogenase